jgi:hypothetical protein
MKKNKLDSLQSLDPDPLVRSMDLQIRNRIRTKMSRIPNTGFCTFFLLMDFKTVGTCFIFLHWQLVTGIASTYVRQFCIKLSLCMVYLIGYLIGNKLNIYYAKTKQKTGQVSNKITEVSLDACK